LYIAAKFKQPFKMPQLAKLNLPIGYWLKRADTLFTELTNQLQAANGVTRSEWQVLNLLYEAGGLSYERLFEFMRTFVKPPELDAILARFKREGWVERTEEGVFQLSEEGQSRHSEILDIQQEARQQAFTGVNEEEYATLMRVLQRIVSNLESGPESTRTLGGDGV
jgi:DNA-binding MarR family transcriptional regulator